MRREGKGSGQSRESGTEKLHVRRSCGFTDWPNAHGCRVKLLTGIFKVHERGYGGYWYGGQLVASPLTLANQANLHASLALVWQSVLRQSGSGSGSQ